MKRIKFLSMILSISLLVAGLFFSSSVYTEEDSNSLLLSDQYGFQEDLPEGVLSVEVNSIEELFVL